ncbi:glycosyltransferase family 4 protein [Chroococcidiopsis sp. TS-821]|uniref:glycosyltransferase family 4 protein n=1 Tax=Chroococcidiopsis sp. TS-821 TaxID=1378066 RepID=UPI000CEDE2CF|nr:glycosyltransferase family 4 protein [Chroococcidiopsis sp. TS-821]PPS42808.1 glycosyl transferase family 1 [Chroococcidiopsis sp. TS-821]
MKILLASHVFYPSIGGIETVSSMLAHEFVELGHEVKLVTQTPASAESNKKFSFEIIRKPKPHQLIQLLRWCDVFFQNNISLQTWWATLFVRKPWFVTHQTWIRRVNGSVGWQDRVKCFLLEFATCISISQSIAKHLKTPSIVIGNPYQDDLFYELPEVSRDRELVFLGRLVSDKGVDLLITALGNLKKEYSLTPRLTIIGAGPEENLLRNLAATLEVSSQVNFVGTKTGTELVKLLNSHKIMVVPSRWSEPFGVVALEGIACGCVVVGSEGGGLKDAIGPCGITFPNGDVKALTQILAKLLTDRQALAVYRSHSHTHLSQFKKQSVAQAYLKLFEGAIK